MTPSVLFAEIHYRVDRIIRDVTQEELESALQHRIVVDVIAARILDARNEKKENKG